MVAVVISLSPAFWRYLLSFSSCLFVREYIFRYLLITSSSTACISLWMSSSTSARLLNLSVPPAHLGSMWWQWISSTVLNSIPVIAHFPDCIEKSEIRLSMNSALRPYEGDCINFRSKFWLLSGKFSCNSFLPSFV